MKIGKKLRELRQQRNLTQEELADRCELSKGFISQVERDLASPSIASLVDMLECLGTSLQVFFTDDSKEKVAFSPADMFEKPDDDAKHGHRGNGLAQYRRGDDHAHGGVDGEQRADHARRRDAPGQHSLCTTNDNVQCKRIAVKHLHDAAERYSTKDKQRHR